MILSFSTNKSISKTLNVANIFCCFANSTRMIKTSNIPILHVNKSNSLYETINLLSKSLNITMNTSIRTNVMM